MLQERRKSVRQRAHDRAAQIPLEENRGVDEKISPPENNQLLKEALAAIKWGELGLTLEAIMNGVRLEKNPLTQGYQRDLLSQSVTLPERFTPFVYKYDKKKKQYTHLGGEVVTFQNPISIGGVEDSYGFHIVGVHIIPGEKGYALVLGVNSWHTEGGLGKIKPEKPILAETPGEAIEALRTILVEFLAKIKNKKQGY